MKRYSFIDYYSSLDFLGLFILAFIVFMLLYVRFYKRNTIYDIENKYNEMDDKNKTIIKRTITFIMIIIPILWFCIGRLYEYGHI